MATHTGENPMDWKACVYRDDNRLYDAIQVAWPAVERLLGHEHGGTPADDSALLAILASQGAPAWIQGASGWIDEDGWGVIGPARSSD